MAVAVVNTLSEQEKGLVGTELLQWGKPRSISCRAPILLVASTTLAPGHGMTFPEGSSHREAPLDRWVGYSRDTLR